MKSFVGILMMVAGLSLAGVAFAQTAPTTSTKPATPACCGEKCQKMGTSCCKVDAGKTTCSMGGSCCTKP